PPKNLPLTAAERAPYVGRYTLTKPDGSPLPVQILDEHDGLVAMIDNENSKLQFQGGHTFVAQRQGRIEFDVANGKVTGFVLNPGGVRPLEAVRGR
ncbi:MAG TPA: hypothetical protein VGM50_05635, partial [Gemmatimonadaceae bacterium]